MASNETLLILETGGDQVRVGGGQYTNIEMSLQSTTCFYYSILSIYVVCVVRVMYCAMRFMCINDYLTHCFFWCAWIINAELNLCRLSLSFSILELIWYCC